MANGRRQPAGGWQNQPADAGRSPFCDSVVSSSLQRIAAHAFDESVGDGEMLARRAAGRPRPCARRRSESSSRRRVCRARAALLSGSTRKPVSPSTTISARSGKRDATTGRPAAIASRAAQTPPPRKLGTHTTSARCKKDADLADTDRRNERVRSRRFAGRIARRAADPARRR